MRIVVLHSVLLLAVAGVEPYADVRAGWSDAVALLAVFILGPAGALLLHRYGHRRAGGVLLLGIMPAAALIHMRTLLPVLEDITRRAEIIGSYGLYAGLIVMLAAASLVGSLVALAIMRETHPQPLTKGSESTP